MPHEEEYFKDLPRQSQTSRFADIGTVLLHALLIAPVADKLSAEGRVVFFPHGPFVLTPFAALRSPAKGAAALLDSHTVHVGASMRSMETRGHAVSAAAAPGSGLVVGYPRTDVDAAVPEVASDAKSGLPKINGWSVRSFTALPGARESNTE